MRAAAEVMGALASSGLTADQLALVMELAATVAAEARPVEDKAAQRRRERDRDYQAERRRQMSADSGDLADEALSPLAPPKVSPEPLSNNPPIIPIPKPITASAKFSIPEDIPAEPFASFVEMRKSIGKKMTDQAKRLAVAKLRKLRDEDGWPPGEVLNHCTLNSYQGLFPPPPKDQRNGHGKHSPGIGKTAAAIAKLGDWNDQRPM